MHYFLKFILGLKLYMFRTVPLSIIRSFSLYTQQWYMSYSYADSLRAGSGWNAAPSWSCSQAVSLEDSLEESTRVMNYMDPHNVQDLLTLRMAYNKHIVFPRALNDGPFVMD